MHAIIGGLGRAIGPAAARVTLQHSGRAQFSMSLVAVSTFCLAVHELYVRRPLRAIFHATQRMKEEDSHEHVELASTAPHGVQRTSS